MYPAAVCVFVGRLTDAERAELHRRLSEGDYDTQAELADEFGVVESTVSDHKKKVESGRQDMVYRAEDGAGGEEDTDGLMNIDWNDADDTEEESEDEYECGNCGATLSYLQEECDGCGDMKAWGGITDDTDE